MVRTARTARDAPREGSRDARGSFGGGVARQASGGERFGTLVRGLLLGRGAGVTLGAWPHLPLGLVAAPTLLGTRLEYDGRLGGQPAGAAAFERAVHPRRRFRSRGKRQPSRACVGASRAARSLALLLQPPEIAGPAD